MTSEVRPPFSAVLKNAEFRVLWAVETQSLIGDQLTTVALAILVYGETGSPLWAALVYSLTFLPALAGGLGLAQLADRFPRRTVLTASAAIQGVFVAAMAIPETPLAIMCVLVVLARLTGAAANAAQNALARDVFTDDDLFLRSQDLRGITTNTAMLLGLAGGGLIVGLLGPSWALAIDAATFFIAAIVVHRYIQFRPAAGQAGDPWFGAIRWVFKQRRLRILIWFSWLVGFAVVPEGLAAPLAAEIGASEGTVGWLLAADPLGFVIGTFVLSHYVSAKNRVRLLGPLAIAPLAILVVFAFKPNLVLALLLLALAGAAGAYLITATTTFITLVPNDMRGGAGGVYRTGLRVAQGIGVAFGGVIAEVVNSPSITIAIASAIGVIVAIPVALSWARTNTPNGELPN